MAGPADTLTDEVLPMKSIVTMLAILASGMLAACGQKGPLYLPDNPSRISINAPAPAENDEGRDAEERDDEDDDNER